MRAAPLAGLLLVVVLAGCAAPRPVHAPGSPFGPSASSPSAGIAQNRTSGPGSASNASMRLETPLAADPIPTRYTCDGSDVSPGIAVVGAPSGTVALVVYLEDPDAPGGEFLHWLAWNVPYASVLSEGGVSGTLERNGFGKRAYGGPCPPKGQTHRYVLTVFALGAMLSSPPPASSAAFAARDASVIIAEAQVNGTYARP